jgi:O-antigen/teichoic acid export membrane protein
VVESLFAVEDQADRGETVFVEVVVIQRKVAVATPHYLLPSPGRVTDHLVRNSLYLMISAGIQAVLGFTFWIVMARLFSTEDIGRASSLISATTVIAYFSLFGLNSTLVRFLPTAPNKGPLITAAFILVAGVGSTIGLCYILLTPVLAPRLAFVEHRPALMAGFVLFTAAAAVNLLTDSVFIASRRAGFCALTDGAVGGLSKIVFGITFAGTGAYGLFCVSAGGFVAAAVVSVVLIITVLHWRPSLKEPFLALKPLLKFSGANYVANALNLLPVVVLPLIVLDRLGAQAAAYYFVAFQMATLLYAAVYAVESAFLAEGSQAEADWRAIRRRSRRLAIMLFVPAGGVLVLTAHWVLLAFGSRYSQHGTTSLELLAVAVIPIAASNWSWTVLRLAGRLTALVVSNAVYSSAICGLAWILASHGLVALTAAWPVGATLTAAIATVLSATVSSKAPGTPPQNDAIETIPASNGARVGKRFPCRNGETRLLARPLE